LHILSESYVITTTYTFLPSGFVYSHPLNADDRRAATEELDKQEERLEDAQADLDQTNQEIEQYNREGEPREGLLEHLEGVKRAAEEQVSSIENFIDQLVTLLS